MTISPRQIGIFDSGIGGLSLVEKIIEQSPFELSLDYISDNGFAPYGHLSQNEIKERCHINAEKLMHRGCELIVLACNTATAMAIDSLRAEYPHVLFVGVEPYLNVLVREPDLLEQDSFTTVITTKATALSQRFQRLKDKLDPQGRIDHHVCSNLASLIEEAFYSGASADWIRRVEEELSFIQIKQYRQVILGCTHYSLIETYFKNVLDVRPIGASQHVAKRVFELLNTKFRDSHNSEGILGKSSNCLFWFESTQTNQRFCFKSLDFPLDLYSDFIKNNNNLTGVQRWEKLRI